MSTGIAKGIILAGGSGNRLYPMSSVACKQLLPVYDKPMIYYPLSTLMQCGITEILVVSTPSDTPKIRQLLGDGSRLGISIFYAVQPEPKGIAEAITIGAEFIGRESFVLILGDNIFYGDYDFRRDARSFTGGSTIYTYVVRNPERYGVVTFDGAGKPETIVEKPKSSASHQAVTGLYFYDSDAVGIATTLKPSGRGELEITDVNRAYLGRNRLSVVRLGRGIAWLDTGTPEDMIGASEFIATIEKRQGRKIGCIEEVAYQMGYIDKDQLKRLIEALPSCGYRSYLQGVVDDVDTAK